MPLASADPDVRLDDARALTAGLLERLAREQRAVASVFGVMPLAHAAIATTRGEAVQAMQAYFEALPDDGMYEGSPEDVAGDMLTALHGSASLDSDTLDAWAKALRSAVDADDAGDALRAAQARLAGLEKAFKSLNAFNEMSYDTALESGDVRAIEDADTADAWLHLKDQIAALRTTTIPALEAAVVAARKPAAPVKRKCNRHDDCDDADKKAVARGSKLGCAEHCHDDCCEECFGN